MVDKRGTGGDFVMWIGRLVKNSNLCEGKGRAQERSNKWERSALYLV